MTFCVHYLLFKFNLIFFKRVFEKIRKGVFNKILEFVLILKKKHIGFLHDVTDFSDMGLFLTIDYRTEDRLNLPVFKLKINSHYASSRST